MVQSSPCTLEKNLCATEAALPRTAFRGGRGTHIDFYSIEETTTFPS